MLVSGNGSINLRQLVNPGVISALIALLFGDRLAASLPGGKRAVLHRLHQYARWP